jgi:hypothetical protein
VENLRNLLRRQASDTFGKKGPIEGDELGRIRD